ncbi:putative DNA-directed RNA polymerase subunit delta [Lactobacillus delbrueckii subsp. lactis]|uniref:DNA-directed RNA polymerase subunit delta n=1 Tax=Lactobacillus delbrueckii TaxID=1584 RepID=UPI000555D612|nr:DNA-directed RNA polymerase subunit delta [Lactobacillus delbrueckii]APG69901.1 DNA-directed RNA polymerase subunit delta [Lactobacillus delbrueckii subsp. lactis]ASW63301.1 DNA-directed RNA polymerase subunit delta [Lactobacillus delbrueckii subsp. lactis]MCD5444400.1 DNA-directed RNA polymerase subunit delta [Lactobacillus delbrueckii subsp. lactis]MCD5507694.1 DNA-directed RNA polymerase subunit delta [Lactobacillus delbrueckii subsp. lactis]MCD5509614.1 DNA-directed RNA polymerase subun
MGLADFKDVDRNELSMIEVAHAILEDRGERMAFADIVNEMQKYLNKSDEEIRQRLPQFYTDINTDGRFISMGENVWALRTWFKFEAVDEEVDHPEDDGDEASTRRHHRKVNAFLATTEGDDVIDYENDDPEDEDLSDDSDADEDDADDNYDDDYDDNEDDEDDEDDDSLPDGIEGQLSQMDDDDLDDGEDEE